jgi:hypothetical protein
VYVPSSVSVTTLEMPAVGYTVYPGIEMSPEIPVPTPPPMPKADTPPASPSAVPTVPTPSVPLEGRSVSLPRTGTKWIYPAYGESPRRASDSQDRALVIRK